MNPDWESTAARLWFGMGDLIGEVARARSLLGRPDLTRDEQVRAEEILHQAIQRMHELRDIPTAPRAPSDLLGTDQPGTLDQDDEVLK